MKLQLMTSILVAAVLTGCSSSPKSIAYVTEQVTENADIDKSTKLGVFATKKGNTEMTSTYIAHVVRELKDQGFSNVYTKSDVENNGQDVEVAVMLNVGHKKLNPDELDVKSRISMGGCSTVGQYFAGSRCAPEMLSLMSRAKRDSLESQLGAYVTSSWIDLSNNEELVFTVSSTFEQSCSEQKTFNALISESLGKIDLSKASLNGRKSHIESLKHCL